MGGGGGVQIKGAKHKCKANFLFFFCVRNPLKTFVFKIELFHGISYVHDSSSVSGQRCST